MRYRLRTLLIVLALGPPLAWGFYNAVQSLLFIILGPGGIPDQR